MFKNIFKQLDKACIAYFLILLSGCAATTQFQLKPLDQLRVDANDNIKILRIGTVDNQVIKENSQKILWNGIRDEIQKSQSRSPYLGVINDYEVNVDITSYALGESFSWEMVRWTITMLQPIHIEAKVSVFSMPERKKLSEFTTESYQLCPVGSMTLDCINGVRKRFEQGVAKALTGYAY